jgi:hypothetical protein
LGKPAVWTKGCDKTQRQPREHTGGKAYGHRKGDVMTRILLTAIAISLIVPLSADAASKKRRSYEYGHQYGYYRAAQVPVAQQRRGPPWAMPNECFYDEGYGRWSPCGGRDR